MKKLFYPLVLSLAALLAFTGCTGPSETSQGKPIPTASMNPIDASQLGGTSNPVKIGIVNSPGKQNSWLQEAAKTNGIAIEFHSYGSCAEANDAIAAGELSLDQCQNLLELAQYENATNNWTKAVQSAGYEPLSVFTKDYTELVSLKNESKIAIPDNPTGQARAIALLASVELVQVNGDSDPIFTTIENVSSNSKVKLVPTPADQLSKTLEGDEFVGAVLDNKQAKAGGLDLEKAALVEDSKAETTMPFVGIWAGPLDIQNTPAVIRLLQLAASTEYSELLAEQTDGNSVLADLGYTQLDAQLAVVHEQLLRHS